MLKVLWILDDSAPHPEILLSSGFLVDIQLILCFNAFSVNFVILNAPMSYGY